MASIEYIVSATGNLSAFLEKASLTADSLDHQLADLSKRIAEPEVDLKDTKFTLAMANAAKRLDKLGAMVADPEIKVDSEKAQLEILRVNAMLDRLDHKRVTATVDVNVDRSFLSRLRGAFGGGGGGGLRGLFGGGGKDAGAGGSALGGILNAVPVSGQAIGIGALGLLGAAVGPALLPAALGLGVGGLAVGGGAMLGQAAEKQMQALAKQLGAKNLPAGQARLIRQQMAQIQRQNAGPLGILGGFENIAGAGKDVFNQALSARPVTMGPAGPVRGQSFIEGLLPVFKQIQGFIKSIGPDLGNMFRASLPFLKTFTVFMEQLAKTLLPVFTNMLKQMQPYLPLIGQGLAVLIDGLAKMLQAIGPRGMKASADIFVGLCHIMGEALILLGQFANGAAVAIDAAAKWIHRTWRDLQHNTAVIFDGMRHEIAHVWDIIYNNSIGAAIRIYHDVFKQEQNLRHSIAVIYDGIRHDIASAWDIIWRNTIGRIARGIADVQGMFRALPGKIVNALWGLGHQLYAIGHSVLTDFWNGLKSVAGSVFSWVGNFAKNIWDKVSKFFKVNSPSGLFYDLGKNLMLGLLGGIKDHAHKAQQAAQEVSRRIADAGGGVQRWAPLVRRALSMEGLSQSLVGNVLYQMQTESGGNPNIQNNWDINAQRGTPSAGLMQVIGPTFGAYHWPGTSWNILDPLANIAAALNYARNVYGPSLMSGGMGIGSGHGYDSGGWLPPGVSIAVNKTGRPERVLGPGEGGTVININVAAGPGTNRRALAQELADLILYHTKTGGRLYPVGTAPR